MFSGKYPYFKKFSLYNEDVKTITSTNTEMIPTPYTWEDKKIATKPINSQTNETKDHETT